MSDSPSDLPPPGLPPEGRLQWVYEEIAKSGRNDVTVIVVTKTHAPDVITHLLGKGCRHFGENRVGEAKAKFPLVSVPPGVTPVYHHIGPLQSGQARQVVSVFDWVHGVSSPSGLAALADAAERAVKNGHRPAERPIRWLAQLNLTGETSKLGGMTMSDFDAMQRPTDNASLVFGGFMAMGPSSGDPAQTRSVFRRLREIRDVTLPGGALSMGMTGDWRIAVEEGATHLRIGSLILGARHEGPWHP
ncbi:MAG: alanine racemase [Spirochaetia bacterium]|nr:alanine racemase [Spirochaetia bacterium]